MNISMLHEQGFLAKLREEWMRWKTHAKYHPNRVLWWDPCVKRMVRLTFQREGTESRRDRVAMENYYYTVIQQALQAPIDHVKKATALIQLKAKLIRLQSQENQRILLTNGDSKIIGEEVSVHQYIKTLRRGKARTVNRIRDGEGNIHTTSAAILRTITDHMRRKYDEIQCSTNDIKELLSCGIKELPPEAGKILESPITLEELHQAVTAGKRGRHQVRWN